MSGAKKATLAVVAVPLALVVLVTAAWGVDDARSSDRVARNVTLASVPVGHKTQAELRETVDELAAELPDTEVVIDAGEFQLTTTAGELGMSIDVDRTIEEVREESGDGPLPTRPVRWVQSFFGERKVDAVLDVDVEQLAETVVSLEGDRRTVPVEPTLEATPEGVKLVPGKPGTELTVHDVVAALPQHVDDVDETITISAKQTVTEPKVADDAVAALAEQANAVTSGEISLEIGGASNKVDGAEFRPAFGLAVDGTTPRLTMQPDPVAEILAKNVPSKANPTGVRFDFQGGVPVPVGGEDAAVCCTDDAPETIVAALLAGETTIPLPTRTMTAQQGREWAAGLGVKEIVGSYTTHHKGGESRVTNIHRMADILRGTLIPPGSTFSVNDTVGRRTVEKGFVEGGVIQDGEFTTDIGGGVSQFATTLFNAAFFGGLDIPVYKAHSKYISRYPFGREATLAYPGVDLKIRNDTPYGIVIWPTYTNTSITVDLWSTRTAVGEQTGQNKSSGCGAVTTERTRTFTDGRVEKDTFKANYDCD